LEFRYDDPNASRVSSHRQAKRRKKEANEGDSSTPQTLESYDAREFEEEDIIVADEAGKTSEMDQPS
jgi:tRNA (adenine-N(1)-)-methyltransferase non-catalytic subunit